MKNQVNFVFNEEVPSLLTGQTKDDGLKTEISSSGKPVSSMQFNVDKSSPVIFRKINTICSALWKVKRKYVQEKQSRNYWNSIN